MTKSPHALSRHRTTTRLLGMFVVGVLAAVAVGLIQNWTLGVISGWGAACITYVSWVWLVIGRADAAATARHATREDPSRSVADLLIVLASLASLGAIVVLLTAEHLVAGPHSVLAVAAVLSVALSWALMQTLFTLRYASLYYGTPGGAGAGIEFNQTEPPSYDDFAYLSFTIGMTYQVSDTALTNQAVRRTVLRHALLSFPFGAGIVATVINLVAGLSY